MYNFFKFQSDVGQQFLRAARAGNLQKILSLINQQNADINACNTVCSLFFI